MEEDDAPSGEIIVVSNREPYEHVHGEEGITVHSPAGGLVTALEPVMHSLSGTWVAWGSGDADREVVDKHDHVLVPPDDPAYTLRRVWLTDEERAGFYEGHANQTLWPLCHAQMEHVRFSRAEWDTYQHVNRRFAEVVREELTDPRGIVWFHDYHFATAPRMLRDEVESAVIAQFWHIPWPPWEVFRIHPQRRAILEGLLGCDFIGMHLDLFCQNFLQCVHKEFGYPVDMEQLQVVVGNRTVHLGGVPISIDAKQFEAMAGSKKAERFIRRFRERHNLQDVQIGIGAERTDYTKGILERLQALEQLFTIRPELQGQFTFVQVGSISRGAVPAYARFWKQVQAEIKRINAQFAIETWQPIRLVKNLSHEKLAALYRTADLAIVSSLQDGMNLVSKEFIAAQVEEKGVLLLSEFAGAAEEMPQAVIINPYDTEGFANAIHQALTMKPAERRVAIAQLRQHLFDHTIADWTETILERLQHLGQSTAPQPAGPTAMLDHLEAITNSYKQRPFIELFCDYDGVLSPISPRPEDAVVDEHLRGLLTRLRDSESVHVNVISGRAIADVSERVGVERLTYAGNHGLQIVGPKIEKIHVLTDDLQVGLSHLYEDLRLKLRDVPGVIVENKDLTLTIHYRLCDRQLIPDVVAICHALFDEYNHADDLRLTTGKQVVEFRPAIDWDKGRAVEWILEELHGTHWPQNVLPIYLGDDVTDEDAFAVLVDDGVGIRVGYECGDDTKAHYTLNGMDEVALFLDWLLRLSVGDVES